ncbi:hypothetical protein FKM82_020843 [Ascaphus truei]
MSSGSATNSSQCQAAATLTGVYTGITSAASHTLKELYRLLTHSQLTKHWQGCITLQPEGPVTGMMSKP